MHHLKRLFCRCRALDWSPKTLYNKFEPFFTELPMEVFLQIYKHVLLQNFMLEDFIAMIETDPVIALIFQNILEDNKVTIMGYTLRVDSVAGHISKYSKDISVMNKFMVKRNIELKKLHLGYIFRQEKWSSAEKVSLKAKEICVSKGSILFKLPQQYLRDVTTLSISTDDCSWALESLLKSKVLTDLRFFKFGMKSNRGFLLLKSFMNCSSLQKIELVLYPSVIQQLQVEELDAIIDLSKKFSLNLDVHSYSLDWIIMDDMSSLALQQLGCFVSSMSLLQGADGFDGGIFNSEIYPRLKALNIQYSTFQYDEVQVFRSSSLEKLYLKTQATTVKCDLTGLANLKCLHLSGCLFTNAQRDCFPSTIEHMTLEGCIFEASSINFPVNLQTLTINMDYVQWNFFTVRNASSLVALSAISINGIPLSHLGIFLSNFANSFIELKAVTYVNQNDTVNPNLTHLSSLKYFDLKVKNKCYESDFNIARLIPYNLKRFNLNIQPSWELLQMKLACVEAIQFVMRFEDHEQSDDYLRTFQSGYMILKLNVLALQNSKSRFLGSPKI
ncbi:unnamed protein product [Ambrosiozyma monospora]|uniref:Unnamed protein product n=1 Tax=Ambrosiozyma monospora TaxID=43982 RepID=A0A9W6YYY0_AMBMO|nr:unnamed protein product [Ambrosiozyma monospora]